MASRATMCSHCCRHLARRWWWARPMWRSSALASSRVCAPFYHVCVCLFELVYVCVCKCACMRLCGCAGYVCACCVCMQYVLFVCTYAQKAHCTCVRVLRMHVGVL